MVSSVRQAAACIGVATRPLSIRHDFFGLRTSTVTVSLDDQLRGLSGRHIHLNCIRVGFQIFNPAVHDAEIDRAVMKARELHAGAGIGIGRVQHFGIDTNKAGMEGYLFILRDEAAEDLTEDWSVPNDAIDTFFTLGILGRTLGMSPEPGTCDKDTDESGLVIEMNSGGGRSDDALPHELGHYLGLEHRDDDAAVMSMFSPTGSSFNAVEAATMQSHCMVKPGC